MGGEPAGRGRPFPVGYRRRHGGKPNLMVWLDAATGTWSAFVLGTQRAGFITAAAAQEAALRLARAQPEEGLRRSGELEPAADAGDVRA